MDSNYLILKMLSAQVAPKQNSKSLISPSRTHFAIHSLSVGQRLLALSQEIRTWPAGLRAWVTPRKYQYTPAMSLINNDEHDRGEEIITGTQGLRGVKHSKAVKCIKGFQGAVGIAEMQLSRQSRGQHLLEQL